MKKNTNDKLQNLIKRRDAYKKMYRTIEGKTVLDEIIKHCKIYDVSMGSTPTITAFNEGRRSVGLHILHVLGQDDRALEYISKKLEEQYKNHILDEVI